MKLLFLQVQEGLTGWMGQAKMANSNSYSLEARSFPLAGLKTTSPKTIIHGQFIGGKERILLRTYKRYAKRNTVSVLLFHEEAIPRP